LRPEFISGDELCTVCVRMVHPMLQFHASHDSSTFHDTELNERFFHIFCLIDAARKLGMNDFS